MPLRGLAAPASGPRGPPPPTLPVALADRRLTRGSAGCETCRRSGRITVETPGTGPLIRALCDGGPRPLFGALRRAGSHGRTHTAAPPAANTASNLADTANESPRMPLPRAGLRCGTHRSRGVAQGPRDPGRRDALGGAPTGSELLVERAARKLSTYPAEPGARFLPQCSRITAVVVSSPSERSPR